MERAASRHVFRAQVVHKRRQLCDGLDASIYYTNDGFVRLVQQALTLIASGDPAMFAQIGNSLNGFVEVSGALEDSKFSSVGIPIGVWYHRYAADKDSDLMKKAVACSIVQLAVCCRLLRNVAARTPYLYDCELRRRIKKISILRMHRFTILAGFESRYSYEIECRLKSGAYGC